MTAATPEPTIVRGVMPAALFEAFRLYVRALARSGTLQWEEWGRRYVRHNDPLAVLVHRELAPRVRQLVGRPIVPSYVFLASYGEGGGVPPHRDRAQCRYTLDLCVDAEGPEWPLIVDGRAWGFGPNEALLYRGCELEHWREPAPSGCIARLAFFHFVDEGFEGSLD